MSVVFRKSMFGFNKDDVLNYINELFGKINAIEADFNEKNDKQKKEIIELSESLNNANQNIAKLMVENDSLLEEVQKLRSEKEKIERLSDVIGKLYLVSKLNAETITRSAKETKKKLDAEIESELKIVEEAEKRLSELKDEITLSSSEYTDKLGSITDSLNQTKQIIKKNDKQSFKSEVELNNLLEAANTTIK